MDIVLFGALCRPGSERQTAYELLALAVREVFSLDTLPEIAREEGGKPFFPGAPRICFNLSHSHGAAVCALHDRPSGVDVEKLRRAFLAQAQKGPITFDIPMLGTVTLSAADVEKL